MKTISIKFLLILLTFNLTGCKKETSSTTLSDFKYTDKPQIINCENADSKLLNEALYSFENDISAFYDIREKNTVRAYNIFLRNASSGRKVVLEEFASEHSVNIAKALNESGIFIKDGLDYNNDLFKCLGENMNPSGLKSTFNALLTTNSMSKTLYEPALSGKASVIDKDKYLSLYIALEYFYSNINTIDFSQIDYEKRDAERAENAKPNPIAAPNNGKVDFNKRPAKQ